MLERCEREILALIINKPQVLDYIQLIPKYFSDKKHSKLFSQLVEFYKEEKTINDVALLKKLKEDFDVDYFLELRENEWYHENEWQWQINYQQAIIVNAYKEKLINQLNENLKNKKIDYDKYIEEMNKLGNIKLNASNDIDMLSMKDIDMEKSEEEVRVLSKTVMLDKNIKGFTIGQLSIWSGGNASAKSTYLNQLAIESINQGYNVAIYSGELIPKRLMKWINMQCAGKTNMVHNKEKDYWYVPLDKQQKIMNWLNGKLFIYDNNRSNKSKYIINSLKQSVIKNNIKVVILDNLMSMNLTDYGDNKYDVQSELVKDLSALAKELNIHIHFVCHPRKVTNFLRKIDISGSADLTNQADNVFIMHRVNNDFKIKTKEMFKWKEDNPIYNYSNVIEVCKNRDYGIEDCFVGMYFEIESKRLLNVEGEDKHYKWEYEW